MGLMENMNVLKKTKAKINAMVSILVKGYEPGRNRNNYSVRNLLKLQSTLEALLKEIEYEQAESYDRSRPRPRNELTVGDFFPNPTTLPDASVLR